MKQVLLLVGLLFIIQSCVFSQGNNREFNTQAGKKFTLDSDIGGSITINSWDKNTVSVQIKSSKDNLDEFDFKYSQDATGVSLKATKKSPGNKWSNHNLEYVVKVPAQYDLDLNTSGGNIEINGVKGLITGKTSGGNLKMNNLKGTLDLKTSGGNITLENIEANGSTKTSGGNITVNNLKGEIDLKTSGGNISLDGSEFKGNVGTSGGNITFKNSSVEGDVKTSGGNIKVDKAPKGTSVATSGGNITVSSANDHIVAKTSGGNINIDEIDGYIQAKTSGGNIKAKMIGDPATGKRDVELVSSGGDIYLTVPAGLDMDIEVRTTYSDRWRNNKKPEIISDFNLNLTENAEKDHTVISGTGKVGSGKNKIIIKTSGGDIHLKKG